MVEGDPAYFRVAFPGVGVDGGVAVETGIFLRRHVLDWTRRLSVGFVGVVDLESIVAKLDIVASNVSSVNTRDGVDHPQLLEGLDAAGLEQLAHDTVGTRPVPLDNKHLAPLAGERRRHRGSDDASANDNHVVHGHSRGEACVWVCVDGEGGALVVKFNRLRLRLRYTTRSFSRDGSCDSKGK